METEKDEGTFSGEKELRGMMDNNVSQSTLIWALFNHSELILNVDTTHFPS